jgi:molybdenum cofactor synthesis domain-containing protein
MTPDPRHNLNRLVPPGEALEIVLAHTPRLPGERIAFAAAAERVLAEDVLAGEDQPRFPAATMDGFAIIAGDGLAARRLVGEQFAGTVSGVAVAAGTAARIATGAPVPPGADAVIQFELVEEADGAITPHQAVAPGNNIRPIGADMRRGDLIVAAGTVLGPAEIGVLASLGASEVGVSRRPRVAIIATGDELVEPDETPGPGQIRDSNRFSLQVAVARTRSMTTTSPRAELRRVLLAALERADVLITSGGVSVGQRDHVAGLIEEMGHLYLRRLFVKPGKPFHFATAGRRLIFGLPGNPVSSLVAFELLVRPALLTMQGVTRWQRMRLPVELGHEIVAAEDRIEYQRGVVAWQDGRLLAHNTGAQHSARLASLVGANALLILPPRPAPYRAGERIEAMLLDPA